MTEGWKRWEGEVVDGNFLLRQYLAGSEHSAVFLTEYGEHGLQRAAIKLVLGDPESDELRLSRWELTAKLSHPHLIRIFQMGTFQLAETPLLYVVMEYADEDLSQVVPYRPLTAAEAQQMLEPTIDALAYLHSKGFVHSRLKPANIMAVGEELKISSDGLCRIGEAPGSKAPGTYDPPEIHGQGISPAGDIWSLGVTLVESLTQHLPVWESTELEDPLLPETLPTPFFEIAGHCLRRDPLRRWTVADIAAHLRETSTAPRKHTPTRPQTTSAKGRYFVPAALGLALAALLAGPRLIKRQPDAQEGSSKLEQQWVQPEPEQKPVPPESENPAPRTSEENQTSPGDSPVPTSPLRASAGTRAQAGDLVPGEVVHEVLPNVPPKASSTIRGTVRVSVKVRVDPSGRVVSAEVDSPGPSRYFAELALQAARRWEFMPAKVAGQPITSDWMLRFEFTRTTTRSVPSFVPTLNRAGSR
jgi:TonB family protein